VVRYTTTHKELPIAHERLKIEKVSIVSSQSPLIRSPRLQLTTTTDYWQLLPNRQFFLAPGDFPAGPASKALKGARPQLPRSPSEPMMAQGEAAEIKSR